MAGIAVSVSAKEQRKNLSVLAGTAFLRGAQTSVYSVIWQPFVLSLGASMPTLGLINSLGGMNGLVTTLVQPLGGWLADRLGRRPLLLAASFSVIIGYALLAGAGWLNVWTVSALGVIFVGAASLAFPARNSMTAESVRSERHGSAFSLITLATMVPGIIAPLVGGWIADRSGFVILFPIGIAVEAIAVFLTLRYIRETRATDRGGLSLRDAFTVLRRSILPRKGMVGFFAAVAGDSFAWGTGWGLLYGMLTETFHFSAEQLGVMSTVMSLAWAASQMPIGQYIDRRNLKPVMVFSEALGIPIMLIWMTQTSFQVFAISQILFAWTAATWVPVINTYLTRSVSSDERAEAFGRLNMFRGLVAFPAPALGGLLYNLGGMRLPLFANLIGSIIVCVILMVFVHEPKMQVAESRPETV